ncbi:hypothetical protein ACO2Q8_19105 [Larkinella sp. VNQ87]|uniref:hypothetical protein n=1 Tax=Larkinella sp. VNQ87 TaxID=3400921 RepID=UPI003C021AB7
MMARTKLLTYIVLLCLTGCGGNDKPDPVSQNCRVTEVPDLYFDSGSVTIVYDNQNRVSAIRQFSFDVFAFTYDAQGRITTFTVGTSQLENLGNEVHTVTYDANGRIATISAQENGRTTTAIPTYDAQNRITKITVGGQAVLRNYYKRMEYDAAGNVTKVFVAEDDSPEELQAEYKYDAKKSPFVGQPAFQLIPLISMLVDKSHYLSVNNPVQYRDFGYGYTATYVYRNDLPAEMSLLLQETGNPAVSNRKKVYSYACE